MFKDENLTPTANWVNTLLPGFLALTGALGPNLVREYIHASCLGYYAQKGSEGVPKVSEGLKGDLNIQKETLKRALKESLKKSFNQNLKRG